MAQEPAIGSDSCGSSTNLVKEPHTIGVGIFYYGGMHPEHAQATRALQYDGIPVLEIHGCAYQEMALAEVLRETLEARVKCIVFIGADIIFDAKDVRELAECAIRENAIVSASIGRIKPGFSKRKLIGRNFLTKLHIKPQVWDITQMDEMAFTAVPLTVIEKLTASETREYTNSAVINTGFSKNSRPFFSPWKKASGTLETPPLVDGHQVTPGNAFLLRAQAENIQIFDATYINVKSTSPTSYSVRYRNIGSEGVLKREAHDIHLNYTICVPSHGSLDLEQQAALWELEKAGMQIVEIHNCPHIDLVRSELTRIAIDELESDGLFFLDSDIIFLPKDVIEICKEAEARQDVVAAVYCMRKTAHALIGATDVSVGTEVPFFGIGKVLPGLYSGLGFTAIPKAVIEALKRKMVRIDHSGMPGPIYPFYALDVNGNFYSGEDVSFCSRVQGLTVRHIPSREGEGTPNGIDWELKREESPTGHRIWLDTRVRIFHKGSYHYGIEDHSMCVPRYQELTGVLTPTREAAKEYLQSVDNLPSDVKIRSLGLDNGAEAPHSTLE